MCIDSGKRASKSCTNVTSAQAYVGDMDDVGYCDKHITVTVCSSGSGAATEYCTLMGASTTSLTLVKLNAEEVKEIRSALGAGLTSGYPEESRVYYTDGSWHGYSGSSSGSNHVMSCTVHTAQAYQDYLASIAPPPVENPENPGEGGEGGEAGGGADAGTGASVE